MGSLGTMKIHEQNGTFRATMPNKWMRENGIDNKATLDIIISKAIIVLPPNEVSNEDVEEITRDLRQIIKARTILTESKTREQSQLTKKTAIEQ